MVDEEAAVAVAVVSDAEIEMVGFDELGELFKMSGTTICVDALSVILVGVDKFDGGAVMLENGFVDDGSGAVGAVYAEVEF